MNKKDSNLIKVFMAMALLVSMASSQLFAAANNNLKNQLKDLSWDDAYEVFENINQKAEASAVDTGYVRHVSWGGAGGYYYFMPGSLSNNFPASLDKIKGLHGGAGGFMVNLNPRVAIGGLFGGMGGTSAKKIGANFTHFSVGAGFQQILGKYKAIVTPQFMVDFDFGLGLIEGGYNYVVSDESSVSTNITRSKIGLSYMVGMDARYRIDPTWHVGVRGGYFSGKLENLERADFTDNGNTLDFSGPYLAICMGGNF